MKKIIPLLLLMTYTTGLLLAQQTISNPEQITGTYHGESQLFMDYVPAPNVADIFTEREDKKWTGNVHNNPDALPKGVDPALQTQYNQSLVNLATLGVNMDGVTSTSLNANFAPPDPVLDVGANHVIQMSNAPGGSSVRIFDKTGKALTGILTFDTNFFPEADGAGDPIVLYDELADRWVLTEFSNSENGSPQPNRLYVAVSTTPNPVPPATWHVYSFQAPNFPDYPKYGIWPDAYYVTTNEDGPTSVYAMPRAEMLTGATLPAIQRFTMPNLLNFEFQAATPADLDGVAPPAGSPGIIMRMADDAVQNGSAAVDQLEIWEFDVDWTTPANSKLTNTLNLPTVAFSSDLCGFTTLECFPQQGTTQKLDPLRELLMYRVQYRNFGTHQTIVCNHVVDVEDFQDHGGIRWYELRKSGNANWAIHQQGTYSPDASHRWMGSVAMDGQGNIGLAYSVSSSSMFPSLRFTGRTAGDALGQMTVNETSIVVGTAASGGERWGDYASLSVDPSDDCTFWFTGEYQTSDGWATRIASFQIGCGTVAPAECQTYTSTDVPKTIPETETTITSTLNIPLNAVITDVNVVNLTGTHTYLSDLSFSLASPNGTNVQIINQKCEDGETFQNFNINLDDAATNGIPCKYNNGGTYKPDVLLAAFNGENAMGNWVLSVMDNVEDDGGSLTSWGLEICYNNTGSCQDVVTVENTIAAGTYKATTTINATGTVANNATVLFQAGTAINLNAPFTVPSGATFTAEIANCTNAVNNQTEEIIAPALIRSAIDNQVYIAPLELHIAPNPSQYATTISYKVPATESVSLQIVNTLGQSIAQLENGITKSPGIYRVNYQFENQQNGIYFAILTIGKQQITKRMLLLK